MPADEQDAQGAELYTLYRQGVELLEDGSFGEATVPLAEVARRAPEKASVREALGRAYFGSRRFAEAAAEFEAVAEKAPTDDYALFCLGRSLQMLGRHAEARQPLALAACMQPNRTDYRAYRDRARSAAERAQSLQDDAA